MKTHLERKFIRCGRAGLPMFFNEDFALLPYSYSKDVACIDHAKSMIFRIIDRKSRCDAGELALRIGESAGMFYLGHIGYHIDPPYRGRHGAYQACRLAEPLLRDLGLRTLVITTDDDNLPSIRTCEKLGCILECTVDVPVRFQKEYEISARKRRYIWFLPEN
jgi:predicted acetyltransferase